MNLQSVSRNRQTMFEGGWSAVLFTLFCVIAQINGAVYKSSGQPAVIEDVRSSGNSRVVAGWDAEEFQFPHQVSLRMVNVAGGVSGCGGSVIHNEWILTAAHCVANRVTFVVRFGATNLTRPEYIIESQRYYIYPGYIEITAGVQTDDIALLALDSWISYSHAIQPIRIQNSDQKNDVYTGVVLTISGYGLTADGGSSSEMLQYVYLRGISNEECKEWYPNSSTVADPTICAEYYNNTLQSACSGDSGGPLIFTDLDGTLTQVGVTSFVSSSGCSSPFPGGYVRPGHYHEWFTEIAGIDFDWTMDDQFTTAPPPPATDDDDDIAVGTLPTTTEPPATTDDGNDDVTVETLPTSTSPPPTTEDDNSGDNDDGDDQEGEDHDGDDDNNGDNDDGGDNDGDDNDGEDDGGVGVGTLPPQTTTSDPTTDD